MIVIGCLWVSWLGLAASCYWANTWGLPARFLHRLHGCAQTPLNAYVRLKRLGLWLFRSVLLGLAIGVALGLILTTPWPYAWLALAQLLPLLALWRFARRCQSRTEHGVSPT